MRTIEQWASEIATEDGRRRMDAWAAETLFQLTCPPPEYYTTDPAAAEQVRQRAAGMRKFCDWSMLVQRLAFERCPEPARDKLSLADILLSHGQPYDYVGAAWLLDADEELREMGQ